MANAFRPRARACILVLTALTAVAACGSDSKSASTTAATSPPTEAPTTTAAPAPETTAAAATTAAPASTAPAVADTIKIGVAVPDLSAFEAASKAFGVGDPQEQATAMLDGWKNSGAVPVNGHDIEFVYRKYAVISDDEKLAACTGFAQEDKVVAVIGGRDFGTGAQCLAQRFNIPVIDVNSEPSSVFTTNGPSYFTLRTDQNVLFKQFIDWADAGGYLKDKKIGVAFSDDNSEAYKVAKDELAAKGYTVTSEIQTTGAGVGSDQDTVAAQKFQTDGADMLMLFVGGSSVINILSAAAGQGYTPKVIDLDVSEHTTDVLAGILPPDIYGGTNAMTGSREGDLGRDKKLGTEGESCMSNYETFSGKSIPRTSPEPSGEFTNILITCDVANLMLEAIKNAGATVDANSVIKGFESISDMPMASTGNVTFTATDHWGVHEYRTIQFSEDCHCWVAQDDFKKLGS